MQKIKQAGISNNAGSTLVKAISAQNDWAWVQPAENEIFKVTQDADLPTIVFEFKSKVAGEYHWSWVIEWEAKVSGLRERAREGKALKVFKASGSFASSHKRWTVNFSGKVLGGALTVTVKGGNQMLTRTVLIKGQNPTPENVVAYIATLDHMSGFEKLLEKETGSKHFIDFDNDPIVAFDKGYGITQMTNPEPTFEQIWSWKANILAGSSLYKEKRLAAKLYLGAKGRTYTDEQLWHEAYSRWNGGAYHEWDVTAKVWVRKSNVLCDTQTGNIGWLTHQEENKDKTEAELRERDKGTYMRGTSGQSKEHPWVYIGVCYADHVLGR